VVLVTFMAVMGMRVPLLAGQELLDALLGFPQQLVEIHGGLGVGVRSESGSALATAGQFGRENGIPRTERFGL
jgi:hypothetical protein